MPSNMQLENIVVNEFQPCYQQQVEGLVLPIQQQEFGVPITRDDQEDLIDIQKYFQKGNGNFWVALDGDKVVGSIGVCDISNNQVALKKMFVHKDHRGKESGVAAALMKNAIDWCRSQGVTQILLGTISQMKAAQRFYEKHGFTAVNKSDLPPNFPIVPVDTVFYCLDV